jgi:hypothetical protein
MGRMTNENFIASAVTGLEVHLACSELAAFGPIIGRMM